MEERPENLPADTCIPVSLSAQLKDEFSKVYRRMPGELLAEAIDVELRSVGRITASGNREVPITTLRARVRTRLALWAIRHRYITQTEYMNLIQQIKWRFLAPHEQTSETAVILEDIIMDAFLKVQTKNFADFLFSDDPFSYICRVVRNSRTDAMRKKSSLYEKIKDILRTGCRNDVFWGYINTTTIASSSLSNRSFPWNSACWLPKGVPLSPPAEAQIVATAAGTAPAFAAGVYAILGNDYQMRSSGKKWNDDEFTAYVQYLFNLVAGLAGSPRAMQLRHMVEIASSVFSEKPEEGSLVGHDREHMLREGIALLVELVRNGSRRPSADHLWFLYKKANTDGDVSQRELAQQAQAEFPSLRCTDEKRLSEVKKELAEILAKYEVDLTTQGSNEIIVEVLTPLIDSLKKAGPQ